MLRDVTAQAALPPVVTHEMAFAREVAHRVCFMDKGQIVEERAARAFFEDPHHERARAFLEHVL